MKHLSKLLLLVVPISFFLGSWWGFREMQSQRFGGYSSEVRILSQKGFFPAEVIHSFEKARGVRVINTEIEGEFEFPERFFESGKVFDVIQLTSYQASYLRGSEALQPTPLATLPASKNISPDFLSLPFDPDNRFFVPLAWDINGFVYDSTKVSENMGLKEIFSQPAHLKKIYLPAHPSELMAVLSRSELLQPDWVDEENEDSLKELQGKIQSLVHQPEDIKKALDSGELWMAQWSLLASAGWLAESKNLKYLLPKEKTSLVIYLLSIPKNAENLGSAKDFLNYMIETKTAKQFVVKSPLATTLKSLDNSDISKMQKSSFLRELPLTRLEIFDESSAFDLAWKKTVQNGFEVRGH